MNLELPVPQWEPRATLSEALLAQICAAFNLGSLNHASDLGGTYNLNALLLTTTGSYVLRVYRPWVTTERLTGIQQTRKALALRGLPVPQPVATLSGETIVILEGRPVEVEPFVPYDHIADNWDRYEQAFALLGSLHNALVIDAPAAFVPPPVSNYGTPSQLLHWLNLTTQALQKESASPTLKTCLVACQEARDLLLRIDAWWQQASSSLPHQLIHGDYGGGNILFQQDTIVAVLDFDFLAMRERVYELAYTLYWLLWRLEPGTAPGNHSWDRLAHLLAIYNSSSTHPLTQHEFAALPYEMARVPLYWFAEAGFTLHPIEAVHNMLPHLPFSRWLLDENFF